MKLKSRVIKMRNSLVKLNSRFELSEELTNQLELRFSSLKSEKEKTMKQNEQSLRDKWDRIRCTNTCIMVVPEEKERQRGRKNTWRKKDSKFQNLILKTQQHQSTYASRLMNFK